MDHVLGDSVNPDALEPHLIEHITDHLLDCTCPVYSLHKECEEAFGHVPFPVFASVLNGLLARGRVRLLYDPDVSRLVQQVVPDYLGLLYAAIEHDDGTFDPFGLSIELVRGESDPLREPVWVYRTEPNIS